MGISGKNGTKIEERNAKAPASKRTGAFRNKMLNSLKTIPVIAPILANPEQKPTQIVLKIKYYYFFTDCLGLGYCYSVTHNVEI